MKRSFHPTSHQAKFYKFFIPQVEKRGIFWELTKSIGNMHSHWRHGTSTQFDIFLSFASAKLQNVPTGGNDAPVGCSARAAKMRSKRDKRACSEIQRATKQLYKVLLLSVSVIFVRDADHGKLSFFSQVYKKHFSCLLSFLAAPNLAKPQSLLHAPSNGLCFSKRSS